MPLPGSPSGESVPVPCVGYTVADRVRAFLTILQIPSATDDARVHVHSLGFASARLDVFWSWSCFPSHWKSCIGFRSSASLDVIPVGFFLGIPVAPTCPVMH